MTRNDNSIHFSAWILRALYATATLLTAVGAQAAALPLPSGTMLPVTFATSIEAGKAKVNDPVRVHTLQAVLLPDGTRIPKGTVLIGHVTESVPFHFDSSPYAAQKPSSLGIRFDHMELKDGAQPVNLELRVLASAFEVDQASRPFNATELQLEGPMIQVGGDSYWPPENTIRTRGGEIVAYVRKDGIFARPLAASANNGQAGLGCDAVPAEQAVAVFSAAACGLYGIGETVLLSNGTDSSGGFALSSVRTSVEIPAHSAALLEVVH